MSLIPWFKVDDGFASSKPVLRIPRRYRAAAVGLWTLAGTWSAKELTDGFIPDYAIEDFCCSSSATAEHLVKSGLWEKADSGWQFVGWSKYQFTKAKVLEHRAAEAEKKRKWREAKNGSADQQESDMSPRDSLGDNSGTPEGTGAVSRSTRPDQTRPVLSLVTSGEELTLVGTPEPPPRCTSHILEASPPPCRWCADARKLNDTWKQQHQQAERLRRRAHWAAVDACGLCDDTGHLEVDEAGTVRRCSHPEAVNA